MRQYTCPARDLRGVSSRGLRSLLTTTSIVAIVGLMGAGTAVAGALPSGGQTVAGQAAISSAGSRLTVNQTSARAIINWTDFSIGQGASVQFNNGSGATLNRVTGQNASSLNGALGATGSVYLINPNGVVIGKTGVINTGGSFVASALNASDTAFMTGGALTFSGASNASVVNLGRIGALGGNIALIGAVVENDGTLTAAAGTVGLVAGHEVTLADTALDGGLFAVRTGGADTSATNTGSITAAAAELRAQGGNIYALAGNTGGVIKATEITGQGGHIWLTAPGGTVTVDRGAVLDASAGEAGDGGHILVDSTSTTFAGTALARGGKVSGDGGFIETSGDRLTAHGAVVDTTAAAGKTGTWLIDPNDFTIAASGGDISGDELSADLATGNVSIYSVFGGTSGNGDIIVNDKVSWSSASTLTLDAYRNININAAMTVSGAGGVALIYGDQAQNGKGQGSSANGGLSFGLTGTGFGGSLTYTGTGGSLSINGAAYKLLYSMADLQGINNGLGGNYALAGSLDASSVTHWTPIGTDGQLHVQNNSNGFTGNFTGLGHTVSNLTISLSGTDYVGLFGYSSGAVANIGVVGGQVSGFMVVGGLVGEQSGGSISNAYATGAVSGQDEVGGLVGAQFGGSISNAYATGAVTGSGEGAYDFGATGGLVGYAGGSISNSYATGAVTGHNEVGGLVGWLNPVTGTPSVSTSYATGAVSGNLGVGGLVGYNSGGSVTNSYWDTDTTGQTGSAGGTGLTTAQLQANLPAGFDGTVWGGGGGLYPYLRSFSSNGAPQVITGYATTATGSAAAGGQVGLYSGGQSLTPGTTSVGANGYYYALVSPGTVTGATKLGATLTASGDKTVSGLSFTDAPTLTSNTVTGFDISLGQIRQHTSLTKYSALSSDLSGAFGSDYYKSLSSQLSAASHAVIASGAFTIDQALTTSNSLSVTSTGDLTVSAAITLNGDVSGLTLSSGSGAVAVSAPITVNGKGAVAITDSTGLSFGLTSTGFTGSLTYTGTGGSLSINGAAYTLLYSMADLQNINKDLGGNYALAGSQDASLTTGWTPIGTDGQGHVQNNTFGFTGNFTGLGHTVSNLTISLSNINFVGLFGYAIGAIADIGMVGGQVSGGSEVGGLVGSQFEGSISNAYATGAVTGKSKVGGLAGGVYYGSVTNTYATGAVTGTGQMVGGLVGGLVGTTSNGVTNGSVDSSYATGAVTGKFDSTVSFSGQNIGGLVGDSSGSVSRSYATGAVSGRYGVGGLVGTSETTVEATASVDRSYATGAVSGTGDVGGLVGSVDSVAVTNSYWDTQTTGQTGSAGGTGRTTAQLQNALQTGFDKNVWGGGGGLYPYLLAFYPTTPQAISGYATTATGTAAAGGQVGLYSGGQSLTPGTTSVGANGYYYALVSGGSISGALFGATLALKDAPLTASGAKTISGVSFSDASGPATGNVTNFNISSGQISQYTSQTKYSALSTPNPSAAFGADYYQSLSSQLSGADTAVVASGAFTLDTPLTTSAGLDFTAGGDLTVSAAITVNGGGALTLNSGSGAVVVSGPITVNGKGAVAITENAGLNFGLTSKGFTGSLDYGATDQGGTLTIDGESYTLLYSMPGLQGINKDLSSNYALAGSLDATGLNTWTPIGNSSKPFTGNFTGLGHTVSNFTVMLPTNSNVGLFGASSGVIASIGMVGGLVSGGSEVGGLVGSSSGSISNAYATVAVSGNDKAGGLVGSQHGGAVTLSYATGAVRGTSGVGGLVGDQSGGSVDTSYATGAVTGTDKVGGLVGSLTEVTQNGGTTGLVVSSYATGSVTGTDKVGGLVGYSSGSVSYAYATGAVTGTENVGGLVGYSSGSVSYAYATGAVSGTDYVGGLVGYQSGGSVDTSYATGAVTGQYDATVSGSGQYVGGLIGLQSGGSVTNAYATGAVSGTDYVGGLVGSLQSVTQDDATTGSVTNAYATGAVSATGDQTTVGGLVGLNDKGTITNGYWDTFTTGIQTGANGTGLTTAQLQAKLPAGFDQNVWGGGGGLYPYLAAFYSDARPQAISGYAYTADFSAAVGGQVAFYSAGGSLMKGSTSVGANGYYYALVSPGAVTSASLLGGTLTLKDAPLTLSGAQAVSGLKFTDAPTLTSGNVTGFAILSGLVNLSTSQATSNALGAETGVTFASVNPFALAAALSSSDLSITASNGFTVQGSLYSDHTIRVVTTAGDVTISQGGSIMSNASGVAVSIESAGNFINNSGPGAVSATNGSWRIYSSSPTNDVFGGLDSGNTAVWNTAPGAAVTDTGNRYVFRFQPTLTFTTKSDSKTYGTDGTTQIQSDYTISGLQSGMAGAFLGDTADSVFSGGPQISSDGAANTATVRGGPYAINATQGTLKFFRGYAFAFDNTGKLSVTPEDITIAAAANTKTYDGGTSAKATPTVTSGKLYDIATLSETYQSKNAGDGLTLTPQVTFANADDASNYAISLVNSETGVIGKAALTLTAKANTKTYDGTTSAAATPTVSGLIGTDTVTDLVEAYADKNAGRGKTLSVTGYTVNDGFGGGNYTVTTQTDATGVIGKAALTLTATANTKTYDGTTSAAATPTVSGLIGTDTVTDLVEAYADKNAGRGKTLSVTGYTVNDGFGGGNYAVRTVADSTGAIDQAAITVTGGAATKTFGDPDPALPYQLTLGALFGGDTLTGALTRAPGETAGVYSTLVGSLSAPSNYKLTFVGGQLTITGSPEPTYNAASNLNVYNFDTSSPLSSQVPGVPPGAGDNGEGSGSTSSDLQIHKDNKFKSKNISVSGKGN